MTADTNDAHGPAALLPGSDRPASFADITRLIAALPPLPTVPDAFMTALQADRVLAADPAGRDTLLWLGIAQRRFPPQLGRAGFALYAGPHGDCAVDWSALLAPWQESSAPTLAALATDDSVDFDLYELAGAPIGDTAVSPALDEAGAARAMAYGMMAVKPDLDLLVLSTVGDSETGAEASARTVIDALLRRDSTSLALAANRARLTDPLTILATLGGHESCAILGALLAARLAGYPVLIEGLPALAAALALAHLGGRDAAALLGHVRATDIPADLMPTFSGTLAIMPLADSGCPAGDGYRAARSLAALRAFMRA